MSRPFPSSQSSQQLNQLNGLQQAEQNYFMKYANSGFSQINTQQIKMKKADTRVMQTGVGFSKMKSAQNQVLRELKYQYEILRNLPIDDKIMIKTKPKRQPTSDYSSSIDEHSDITSSRHSRHKKTSRDAQILALEKKQLQIVISNSLKKIQQLLQNEMELKKTIHELKLQIQGKGGVNSEYEMQIRQFKKNEKELKQNIENLKMQIQRKNTIIKELTEKNAFLEGQKSRRDQEHKSFFESQRSIEDMLRKQKDRSMNAQLQVKRIQMQFEIYQKDKTAEINRITRQLQIKNSAPEREAETLRRLQEEIRMKDHKIQSFVEQIQNLRGQIARPVSPPPQAQQDPNKKLLEELVKQMKSKNESEAKQSNQTIMKALIDKFGARKDETLKNELSSLRVQLQTLRRNSTVSQFQSNPGQQMELRSRIRQLQRVIEEEKRQKRQLLEQIQKLRNQRDQVYGECEAHRRKVKEYKQTEERLLLEIQELGNFKFQLEESKMENQEIKMKLENIMTHQHHETVKVQTHQTVSGNNIELIQKYEDEIRLLRRKVDELTFALNKANEERAFSENMLKQAQSKEVLRLNEDIVRYRQLLKQTEDDTSLTIQQLKSQIQTKATTIQQLQQRFEELDKANRGSLQSSRLNYESLLKAEVAKHYSQLQTMSAKIIELTKTNESFSTQSQYFARLEKQVSELRRLTRTSKRSNQAIDHLWEIKQAEYNNVNEILMGVRM